MADRCAVDAEKAAESAICEHQRIRQPQKQHVHHFIDLIHGEDEGKALLFRQSIAVAHHAAERAPGKLRHGEKGVHRRRKAGRCAEKGNEQRRIARRHAVGHRHIIIQRAQALFPLEIGGRLAEISPPEAQGKAFAAARRFRDRDLIFDERGEQRQRRLHEQQPRNAERIEEHGGHGHHQHLEHGIEHGGNRVALFLRPLRQDKRVKAAVGQLVKGAQARKQQRKAEIHRVRELTAQQVDARERIEQRVHRVAADKEGLSRIAVHQRRDQKRQHRPRQQLDRHHECRGQRAARFVEDEKRQCKAADDAACRAERGRERNADKILCPERFCHSSHLAIYYGTVRRRKKDGICGKLSPLRYRSIAFFHFSARKSSSSAQASR